MNNSLISAAAHLPDPHAMEVRTGSPLVLKGSGAIACAGRAGPAAGAGGCGHPGLPAAGHGPLPARPGARACSGGPCAGQRGCCSRGPHPERHHGPGSLICRPACPQCACRWFSGLRRSLGCSSLCAGSDCSACGTCKYGSINSKSFILSSSAKKPIPDYCVIHICKCYVCQVNVAYDMKTIAQIV